MTFRKTHPLIDQLTDELIHSAAREESMRIAMILDKSSAAKLRKAQTRRSVARKALIRAIKEAIAAETHIPTMAERSAHKLAKKERTRR